MYFNISNSIRAYKTNFENKENFGFFTRDKNYSFEKKVTFFVLEKFLKNNLILSKQEKNNRIRNICSTFIFKKFKTGN